MKLFKGYYSLQSHDEQNAYLFGLIRKVPIARKRAEGSTRRTCTFNYYIRVGGQETQVCVKALANIHGVGKSKIHILCEKLGQSVLFPRDERGRHSKMPKKVSDETIELVQNHIYSIIRTDKVKNFLKDEKANNGPDVNITQMHKDFLDIYDPEYREELANYENRTFQQSNYEYQEQEFRHELCYNENKDQMIQQQQQQQQQQPLQQQQQNTIANPNPTNTIATMSAVPGVPKKKRKTMKDGRPEPLIRQWFYSKIFHDIYTTKEALALRKKIMSWKCSDGFLFQKAPRKQRKPKKVDAEVDQQQNRLQRLTKATNTNTPVQITPTPPLIPIKKKVQEVQIQNVPLKKKSVQVGSDTLQYVFQAPQGQDTYSLYPMTILQDLAQIDTTQAVNLTHAQPIQQAQIRTIAPTHFQATLAQPHCTTNGMTISTGNLQALGVNINLAQAGTQYTTNHGIVSYKFE
ncbi:UNVERIFIED_CONTAM: hypothetical protein PYX00_005630 [Menopon gallinae]